MNQDYITLGADTIQHKMNQKFSNNEQLMSFYLCLELDEFFFNQPTNYIGVYEAVNQFMLDSCVAQFKRLPDGRAWNCWGVGAFHHMCAQVYANGGERNSEARRMRNIADSEVLNEWLYEQRTRLLAEFKKNFMSYYQTFKDQQLLTVA